MKKAKVKKRREFMTLMIIQGNRNNVTKLRFPRILSKILFGLLAAFILYTALVTFSAANLSNTYQGKLVEIKNLEEINESQQQEITHLNLITAEVREKLKSLEEIEAKVKKLVGIKD